MPPVNYSYGGQNEYAVRVYGIFEGVQGGALAVAFIMGVAGTALVKSLVENIIMPCVTLFIPGGAWKTATFSLGPVVIGWGAFLGELINFVIIAFVVFMIAKQVMKEEKVTKK